MRDFDIRGPALNSFVSKRVKREEGGVGDGSTLSHSVSSRASRSAKSENLVQP